MTLEQRVEALEGRVARMMDRGSAAPLALDLQPDLSAFRHTLAALTDAEVLTMAQECRTQDGARP